jgi:serine/threonine protein kinase
VVVKSNVLIDQTGNARLADFGLLTILSDPANHLSSSSFTQGGSARWMSPELIDPQKFGLENSRPTKSSDCYALGMVIYETISGHLPFHQHADLTVFVKVLAGERPTRGAGFAESLWKVLAQCWTPQPNDRPNIQDVLQCLDGFLNSPEPPPLGPDGEMEGDYDEWDSGDDSSGTVSPLAPCNVSYLNAFRCRRCTDASTPGFSLASLAPPASSLVNSNQAPFTVCPCDCAMHSHCPAGSDRSPSLYVV